MAFGDINNGLGQDDLPPIGEGWVCCYDTGRCDQGGGCQNYDANGDPLRMSLYATKEECEQNEDRCGPQGPSTAPGGFSRGSGGGGYLPEPQSWDCIHVLLWPFGVTCKGRADTGGTYATRGECNEGCVPIEVPAGPQNKPHVGGTSGEWAGGGSTHIGGGVSQGGRSLSGMRHGRSTSVANSSDPDNTYKCVDDPDDLEAPGTCVPCEPGEGGFGSGILCTSLEDCQDYCEVAYEVPGYRCILDITGEGQEYNSCQAVWDDQIEYNTIGECQANCTGYGGGPGYVCNIRYFPSGGKSWGCDFVQSGGEYGDHGTCIDSCGRRANGYE
jgi:hypothetical protein